MLTDDELCSKVDMRCLNWTINITALNFITQQKATLPKHIISPKTHGFNTVKIPDRDQTLGPKIQYFHTYRCVGFGKNTRSRKYIRFGSGMLLPDVCTAQCDQHIKYIGNYMELCCYNITLS